MDISHPRRIGLHFLLWVISQAGTVTNVVINTEPIGWEIFEKVTQCSGSEVGFKCNMHVLRLQRGMALYQ